MDLRLLDGGRKESVAAIDEERDDMVRTETADGEDGDESSGGEIGIEARVFFWGYGEGIGGDEEGFARTSGDAGE